MWGPCCRSSWCPGYSKISSAQNQHSLLLLWLLFLGSKSAKIDTEWSGFVTLSSLNVWSVPGSVTKLGFQISFLLSKKPGIIWEFVHSNEALGIHQKFARSFVKWDLIYLLRISSNVRILKIFGLKEHLTWMDCMEFYSLLVYILMNAVWIIKAKVLLVRYLKI